MDATGAPSWPSVAEELHIFDPKGDVLLILERRSKKDKGKPVDGVRIDSLTTTKYEEPATFTTSNVDLEPLEAWMEDNPSVEETIDPEAAESEEAGPAAEEAPEPPESAVGNSTRAPQIQEVQLLVSSKHLILSSPVFSTSLGSDQYPEGRTLQTDGSIVISLTDEDPDAMILLMRIIHGPTSKVPRQISLDMFTKLAFVVNHRQMQEAVEFFSDTWIENLKKGGLPKSYTPDVLSLLYIFWVFQKEEDFKNMSQVIERECDDNFEGIANASPLIPAAIIEAIRISRKEVIENMMKIVHDLIAKYSVPETICDREDSPFACDCIVLGTLLKSAIVIGIWPPPRYPYLGITAKTLANKIRSMKVVDGYTAPNGGYYNANREHDHGIKNSIEESIDSLEKDIRGLGLSRFFAKKEKKEKKKSRRGKIIRQQSQLFR